MTRAGRTAIVTGGASGIGRAIADTLAAQGATVAVVDVNAAGAAEAVRAIEAAGGRAAAFPLDITDVPAIERMVADVTARWGGVDTLVNCAGWDRPMKFVDTTPEFWDKILGINLRGPIACTRAVLPGMIARSYGKVVFIASDAGRVGSSGEAVYSAAKGGLIALTKTIAREVARHRINVNCVCPGQSDIPWGRLRTPADVPPAVAFPVSDDA